MNRRLIKIAGRKEAVGRPLLYTTTPEFLEVFALNDLSDLPTLQELAPDPEGDPGTEPAAPQTTPEAAASAAEADSTTATPNADAASEQGAESGNDTADSDDPNRTE